MPTGGWSEAEIERRAVGISQALRGVAEVAHNEAELRIWMVQILRDFAREASLNLEDRHEYALGHGRADSVYGRVLIEFETPGSLADKNSASSNRRAIEQVQRYAETLSRKDKQDLSRILGVATDGHRIIFLRHRRGTWDVNPAQQVDPASVAHLLLCLKSLQGKALLPDNLVQDFGASAEAAQRCVTALYGALEKSRSAKVDALFAQWELLFSEVCGYELGSAKLDVKALAGSYGVSARRVDVARLFFCVHSYYASLIKLLAAEIVTFYSASYLPSYLGRLEALPSDRLRQELVELEEGGIFRQLGVRNFLEGDFFAWYLEAWDEALAEAFRGIVRTLRSYDPATVRIDPDETRDLLKKLYQYLLPKKLRHDLGEYYTPDWLADLVLDEIGYSGDLSKRILDPACGSGTFLVLEIKRAREWARDKFLNDTETLERILAGIVGFDLNPLAVITARTNYLIALGDLLRHRRGEIELPVYLCDSVLIPSESRQVTLGGRRVPLETVVGTFEVPLALTSMDRISSLAALLEQAVQGSYRVAEFLARARDELGLEPEGFAEAQDALADLYSKLRQVDAERRNGIWARIIKNFFAPVFAGQFHYVAGNPPWINWESLPDQYRKSTQRLWENYGLFTLKGWRARMGGGKKDLSALFLYVAADKYLNERGRLGFVITESLFKTSGAGEGFRHFRLGGTPGLPRLQVQRVHDLVELKPFEGAANRTAVIVVKKGAPTRYPVPYVVWRRRPGRPLEEGMTLEAVAANTNQEEQVAFPITSKQGAPWITGPVGTWEAVQKAVGKSDYRAWAGATTWMNGVYWARILEHLPNGKVLIENLHDAGKAKIRRIQTRLESDLLYPLLRIGDVRPWRAEPRDWILMVQDPRTRKGYPEPEMRLQWPLTYAYLTKFKAELHARPGLTKYYQAKDPFYSMYNIGPQTFARVKVVWPQMIPSLIPVVVEGRKGKAPVPQHIITFVPFDDTSEAHYFCALMSSVPAKFIAASYSTGKSFGAPHVLDHVKVPRFDPRSTLHRHLAELSTKVHAAAAHEDMRQVMALEAEIGRAAAELWGITQKELRTIQEALQNRKSRSRPESGEEREK